MNMTLDEIKKAVEDGKTVCWKNPAYQVVKDNIGQWLIKCVANGHCTGLTWADEVTMNGKEEDFYISEIQPRIPTTPEQTHSFSYENKTWATATLKWQNGSTKQVASGDEVFFDVKPTHIKFSGFTGWQSY